MRSIIDNRVGAERRIESRICVPTLDWARMETALLTLKRLLSNLRRKVRFDDCGGVEENEFEIGVKEAWRMCDVLVHIASVRRVSGERFSRPSWIRVHAGPGIMSMVWARSEPWSC